MVGLVEDVLQLTQGHQVANLLSDMDVGFFEAVISIVEGTVLRTGANDTLVLAGFVDLAPEGGTEAHTCPKRDDMTGEVSRHTPYLLAQSPLTTQLVLRWISVRGQLYV